MTDRYLALALLVATASSLPAVVSAQTVRSVRPIGVAGNVSVPAIAAKRAAARPHPKRVHAVYGSIASVGATTLVLLVRGHRLIQVDMTAALADGTFSNPLTVGKFVAVEGEYGAGHVLFAANITRMTRLDDSTGQDR